MNSKTLVIIILVLAGLLVLRTMVTRENLVPIQDDITSKAGFLPSHQGPYFQGLPPTLDMENTYHTLIHDDCAGDYSNLECRQKAYIKTVKGGTTDKADLICLKYKGDEDTYYKCLDGVYGNYIWMDRFTGASPCLCPSKDMPGQGQGALGADGKCWCGKTRPLKQRWQLDQNGEVVDRLHARPEDSQRNVESCMQSCYEMYAAPVINKCMGLSKTEEDLVKCMKASGSEAQINECYASCM